MLNQNEILTIQDYKKDGLTINQTAECLGYDYKTVKKYWNKTIEAKQEVKVVRKCKCDKYRDFILKKFKQYSGYTAIQIFQMLEKDLKEKGEEIDVGESTMRRYIAKLRIEESIPKEKRYRNFRAVVDPEPGEQAQYDFGEDKVFIQGKEGKIKVYFAMVILSYSRYRYVEFRLEPFKTADVIEILEHAFDYFGGCPNVIVIDQDTKMVVKENEGVYSLTEQFSAYTDKQPFRVRLMHKRDPQSKGKVERSNQYLEQNFLNGYFFKSLEQLNEDAHEWLETIANKRVNATTKEPPVQRFAIEQQNLIARGNSVDPEIITQLIKQDNTVHYKGNRYDVPIGSYQHGLKKRARLCIYANRIDIYSDDSGEFLAGYLLEEGITGQLYTLDGRKENSDAHVQTLKEEILNILQDYKRAEELIERISSSNPDFRTDQLIGLRSLVREWIVNKPFLFQCIEDVLDQYEDINVGMIRSNIDKVKRLLDFDLKGKKTLTKEELTTKLGFLGTYCESGIVSNYAVNYMKYLENEFAKQD